MYCCERSNTRHLQQRRVNPWQIKEKSASLIRDSLSIVLQRFDAVWPSGTFGDMRAIDLE